MKEGGWQQYRGDVMDVLGEFGTLEKILTEDALTYVNNVEAWFFMQKYHDNIEAHDHDDIFNIVSELEELLEIRLSELKI